LMKASSGFQEMQVFDAGSVVGEFHLELAFFHATQAFREGANLAKTLKMEFLLRAAATRQIKVAIERCGAKNPRSIILVLWGKDKGKVDKMLKALEAKIAGKKLKADKGKLILLYSLDKNRDIEEQIVEKMVEVQIED